MRSIANRFAAIRSCTPEIALAACACLVTAQASAQSAPTPPAPATYKGCVQKAPGTDGALLISTPTACAKLTGNVPGDDAIGHEIELSGILTPRTTSAAATLQVDTVVSVGNACTKVCALRPAGTRGLRSPHDAPKATPGTEGGTPGKVGPPE
jgi:hypothetical protein